MLNRKFGFDEFEFGDFQSHQNRIFLRVLKAKLEEKGEDLTLADLEDAYQQCWVLIRQDIEKCCILRNSVDHSLKLSFFDLSKCCLTQIDDARDQERDAIELAYNMRSYLICRLSDQPVYKRLEIIAGLKTFFKRKSQVEITFRAASTFPRLFGELCQDMNAIDEVMSDGDFVKLKLALRYSLKEVAPRIVLKIQKYYKNSQLGYDNCKFCNSRWVKDPSEPNITNLSDLSCFTIPEELESFLVLRFRRTFYEELLDFVPFLYRYFSSSF